MLAHYPPRNNGGAELRSQDLREHCRRRAIMNQFDFLSRPGNYPVADSCCDCCSLGCFTGDFKAREDAIKSLISSKITDAYSIPAGFRRPKKLGVNVKKVCPRKPYKMTADALSERKNLRHVIELEIRRIWASDPRLNCCPITHIMTKKQIETILNGGAKCCDYDYLSKLLSQNLRRPFAHTEQFHACILSFYSLGKLDIGSPYPEVIINRFQSISGNYGSMSNEMMRRMADKTRQLQLEQEAETRKAKKSKRVSNSADSELTSEEKNLLAEDEAAKVALYSEDYGAAVGTISDLGRQWKLLMLTWPRESRINIPVGLSKTAFKNLLLGQRHPLTGEPYKRFRIAHPKKQGEALLGDLDNDRNVDNGGA